jgi:hypothetical protein
MPATCCQRSPLISQADLDDGDKYLTIANVPVLDEHRDAERGNVDTALLHRLHRNTAARTARGDFSPISLGHYVARSTSHPITITRPDGTKVKVEADSEELVPKPVGFASGWHIANFRGRPTLHAHFHIRRDLYSEASEFPYRSVERIPGEEFIDRIALLRRPPARDMGAVMYSKRENQDLRICYSRDFSFSPSRKVKSMPSSASIHEAISDAGAYHYVYESQRDKLREMRDQEGYAISASKIEEIASRSPASFASGVREIRQNYAKRTGNFGMAGADRSDSRDHARAIAMCSTNSGMKYNDALAKIRASK